MPSETVIAVDLGASNGRCMLGRYARGRIALEEIHRFSNRPIRFHGHLHWNVPTLFEEVKAGLARCARKQDGIRAIGIDTWGVDFGLLGPGGAMLDQPFCYRDRRTEGCMERAFALVSPTEMYAETGIQFLPFNTLFQLTALAHQNPRLLESAEHLLLMPDLFAFLLTGEIACEYTNSSTTQLLSLKTKSWSAALFERLALPLRIMSPVMAPGTILGGLRPEVEEETGLRRTVFHATATHDTASAIAGIPAQNGEWAFISCGTWSLMGCELPAPITTATALEHNFTNEGGVEGTIRFLKNIQGLWMLQECQRQWRARGQAVSDSELVRLAASAPSFAFFLDPDDPQFLSPPSMTVAIREFLKRTGQRAKLSLAVTARALLESLVLKHRRVLRTLQSITGRDFETIHIVGGGSRNRLLCQWTADATGKLVIAGPAEATAMGNVLVLGLALGWFADLSEARAVVRNSVRMNRYRPRGQAAWDSAEARYEEILGRVTCAAASSETA